MEALLVLANWSTLLVCMVLKLPQVVAVLAAHSARGVSLESLVLELTLTEKRCTFTTSITAAARPWLSGLGFRPTERAGTSCTFSKCFISFHSPESMF
uniref:Secreted protein n=1 Tax=Terrapene triunguis TaxID=2587831 RepID=A0A674J740_9SAUR